MRNATILTAALCLVASQAAFAAPPVLGGYSGSASRPAPAKPSSTWSLPSLGSVFGKGKKSLPAHYGQQPQRNVAHVFNPQQPQASGFSVAGMKHAVMNNPLADAMKPGQQTPAASRPQDTLSLSRPVAGPTVDMLLPMAALAEKSGDLEAARGHFQRAIAIAPTNTKALRQYGRLEDRQGRLAEAEKLYRQAVMADPTSSASLNDLALCYARQNKLEESAQTLAQAVSMQPDKALYRNNIAKVLVELGDLGKAGEHLAAVHGPVVASYNLGQLLAMSGKTDAAIAALQQTIAMDPGFDAAQEVLATLRQDAPAASPSPAATAPQLASRPAVATAPQPVEPALSPQDDNAGQAMPTPSPSTVGPSFPRLLPPVVGR